MVTTEPSRTSDIRDIRWSHRYPDVAEWPVRVEPCISPDYYEREKERLFPRVWLYAGREEEIREPGDYVVRNYDVVNKSILIVRGADDTLRAFHNICKHRGNQLVCEPKGSGARGFQCGFHSWNYRLDGALAGVPGKDLFLNFDKNSAAASLSPVAVDSWNGFVFIHLDPEPDESLSDYLGELGTDLDGFPFRDMTWNFRYSAECNANWKVAVDAFQEFYHVGSVHKDSVAETVRNSDNPFSNALLIKLYERHRLFSGYANPAYRPTPAEIAAFKAGASFTDMLAVREGQTTALNPGVNATGSPTWSFDVNVVFPNLIIDMLNGMYFTQEFWPLGHDRTRWTMNIYLPPATSMSERFGREHAAYELRDIASEDFGNLARTQAALNTGVLEYFTLQDNELTIRHSHRAVERYVGYYSS